MNEITDTENLLLRMAAREKVLFDQSASLMMRTSQNEDPLAIIQCIKFTSKNGDVFPIEIAVASGKLSEPDWTYSSLVRPNTLIASEIGKIESGIATIPFEILSGAKNADTIKSEINLLMNQNPVPLISINQVNLISKLIGANVFEYESKSKEEKSSLDSILKRFISTGRALPDAIFLYRAIKVARSRACK